MPALPAQLPVYLGDAEFPGGDTAGNVLNDVLVELGLQESADPLASTDTNVKQLVRFLKSLGRELWQERDWTHLLWGQTFTSDPTAWEVSLPPGFGRMVSGTFYRVGDSGPLAPATSQQWAAMASRGTTSTLRLPYRLAQGKLQLLLGSIPDGETYAYEYVSRYWVKPAGDTLPTSEVVTSSNDVLWYEPLLLVRGLKLAFLKAKGFDTVAAQADYNRTLQQCMGGDGAAPVLRLDGGGSSEPVLSEANLPDTGYG